MANLPKPLIGLLLGTVAFFAIWIVALKPGASSTGGSPSGVGQYQSAINKAHQAVKTSNAANAKLGAPTATAPAASAPKPAAKPAVKPAATVKAHATLKVSASSKAKLHALSQLFNKAAWEKFARETRAAEAARAAKAKATAAAAAQAAQAKVAAEVKSLQTAVSDHKVVAILFYNPAAADDRAMSTELAAVPSHHGSVVKLAVPVNDLTEFASITAQIPVVTAPTLILIDPARQATTLTGYASQLELNQRVADALSAK